VQQFTGMGHRITGTWEVRSSVRLPLYYDAWRGLRDFTNHIFAEKNPFWRN